MTPIVSYLLSDTSLTRAGSITPSTQTSQEIVSLIYNTNNEFEYTQIDAKIKLAIVGLAGYGEGGDKSDGFAFVVHDGYIYTWMDWASLIRIDKEGRIEVLGKLSSGQGKMAFSKDNLYITGDYKLRKIVLTPFSLLQKIHDN